jgi:hypothetical protein
MPIIVNVVRDFLNILWGILVLINNPFTRKLMIFGSLLSYMLSKFVEINFNNTMLKIPASILCYYCLLRILNYYKINILNEEDPLLGVNDIEKMRVKKALSYLSITTRYKYLETPTNVEFLVDWKNFRENKRYELAQDQYDSDWESDCESDWESDSEDDDIKNAKLYINKTCEEEVKLTDFVENIKTTIEKLNESIEEKNIDTAGLSGEGVSKGTCNNSTNVSENNIIDDKLKDIDDTMFGDEESIKRGWFDWIKSSKPKVV